MARKPIGSSRSFALLLVGLVALALVAGAWFTLLDDPGAEAAGVEAGAVATADEPSKRASAQRPTQLDEPRPRGAQSDGAQAADERSRAEVDDAKRLELANAVWVEGRVVFPAGTPLDERLELVADGKDIPRFGDHRVKVASDGTFRVAFSKESSTGLLKLEGRYLYLEPPLRVALPAKAPVVLEPALGGCIEGRIVPPAGAEVAWSVLEKRAPSVSSWGEAIGALRRKAIVHEDLRYEIRGLPVDRTHMVAFDSGEWVPFHKSEVSVKAGEAERLDIECKLGVRLRGRVVDLEGRPLVGAHVETVHEYNGRDGIWTSPRSNASAENGVFELLGVGAGRLQISATLKGYLDGKLDLGLLVDGETREGLEIKLDAGRSIAGVVRWDDGQPAVGASLVVKPMKGEETWFFDTDNTRTGLDGRFEITGLEEGPFKVEAHAKDGARPDKDADDSSERKSRLKGPTWRAVATDVEPGAQLELVLRLGASLVGQAVDDLGVPIRKFSVAANSSEVVFLAERRVTDKFDSKDGRFELKGVGDGTWHVSASARGYMANKPLIVEVGSAPQPLRLVLPRGSSLAGVVYDAAGEPLAKARVAVESAEDSNAGFLEMDRSAKTDSKGGFKFSTAPSGSITLRATHENFAPSAPLVLELAPGEKQTGLRIVLTDGGSLRGRIDPRYLTAERRWRVSADRDGPDGRRSTPAGDDGTFVLERLSPGEYEVRARSSTHPEFGYGDDENGPSASPEPAMRNQLTAKATVYDGRTTEVVLGAPTGVSVVLRGKVTRAGQPVANASVTTAKGEWDIETRTAANGEYAMVLESSGRHTVAAALSQDGVWVSHTVDVPATGSVRQDFEFSGGRVAGRVVDREGAPVADATVRIANSDPRSAANAQLFAVSRTTDGDGAFEIDGLAAGEYQLTVLDERDWRGRAPRFALTVVEGVALEDGVNREGLVIKVDSAAELRVNVRTIAGAPAVGAVVSARPVSSVDTLGLSDSRTTDGAGNALLGGLGSGEHRVFARLGDQVAVSGAVGVTRDASNSVDLTLRRGGKLSIVVTGAAALNAPLSVVDASGLDWARAPLDWDQDESAGSWSLEPLPPGAYSVRVLGAEQGSATATVQVTAGGTATANLQLQED